MRWKKVLACAALLGWLSAPAAAQCPPNGCPVQPCVLQQPTAGPTVIYQQAPCDTGHGHRERCRLFDCGDKEWLKPWKCEDLEMKPVESTPCYSGCGLHGKLNGLLWCPKDCAKEEPKAEPSCDDNKPKLSGWIQGGYTYNLDGPNRSNVGTFPNSFLGPQFNNRHNELMLNQVWLRLEKTLDHGSEVNWGYTIDANYGQDAADFNVISIGMWENYTGDADATIADDEDFGFDLPQFFVEAHFPGVITEKGLDVRVGRFFTPHGNELSPAIQTDFYSHSYGYFYSWPLTHTGVLTTLHLTDTVDVQNGLVLGWDNVFADNNDKLSWLGNILWTSCDKSTSAYFTWSVGPEGLGRLDSANDDYRYLFSADFIKKFGACQQWRLVLHGAQAWDTSFVTGEDVEWSDYAVNLFYTVDPRLTLGLRAEYFRDDDGYRIGIADTFYELTLGATIKPYQNLRVRPEIRWDRAAHTAPFNDFADKEMFTAAIDFIWEF